MKFLALLIVSCISCISVDASSLNTYITDTTGNNQYPMDPSDISPLLIGEKIPIVRIPSAEGVLFDLNSHIMQQNTILIFYRGGWCPYCNKALSGIQEIQDSLIKMGYQIIAISTDSPENLNITAVKHKLRYTLLSDADLNIAKQFGIAFQAPEGYLKMLAQSTGGKDVEQLLPVPSVFIIDTKGIIQFEYINPDFKQRISPDLLQAVASALKQKHSAQHM
ncbi:Peroxiredoxin [Chitinophaga sancti]|uniref:thioredoxin-dependent peroxiredoxin n=2 Tax=Chitinophaga sancti TaxID=1004 RepID=A0A1K1SG14_9BACT|nr:Peroxiredoxin [Chitinophaga sancti]